jgi:GNAT superfamily N-acetyltransferase
VLVRFHWDKDNPRVVKERFVLLLGSAPVGFAWHRHEPLDQLPKRYGRIEANLCAELRTTKYLVEAYDFIEKRARASGAEYLFTFVHSRDDLTLATLRARGYREERRHEERELDLVAHGGHLLNRLEASRARVRDQGIRLLPLAHDHDPERYRKIYAMNVQAQQDVPTTIPFVPPPFELFMQFLQSPDIREDRVWIARSDDAVVGISLLSYPPTVGVVYTQWTATARSARGRGVARALKLETLGQAISLGVERVRTGNDSENAPILHLNDALGYVRIAGRVELLKKVP